MSEAIVTDKTLTIEDAPADAKATGDAINNLRGAVGSPLVAATVASMTDTNKVYVYTGSETGYTNSNWYYYDGTSWVSGGVYNSVAVDLDTTLTISGKASDSKSVGDAIGELKENLTDLQEDSDTKAAVIYETASGEIASFSDGADDLPVKPCVVTMEPVQDLHGYDSPWPAGGGKNKLNIQNIRVGASTLTITEENKEQNYIVVNGTASSTNRFIDVNSQIVFSNIDIVAGETYIYEITGIFPSSNITSIYVNTRSEPSGVAVSYPSTSISATKRSFVAPTADGTMVLYFGLSIAQNASFNNARIEFSVYKASESYTFEPYSNICPITGRTGLNVVRSGKNLLPANSFQSTTKQGLTYTVNSDGTVSVSGTATTNSYIYYSAIFPVDVIINGIPESNGVVIDGIAIHVFSNEPGIGTMVRTNNNTFVLLANHLVEIRLRISSGVTLENALFKPMARISTDADYSFEPYKGSTYSVNWETEAGTVYGGTLGVVSGKLVVDRAMVDLGTLAWNYEASIPRFYTSGINSVVKKVDNVSVANCVSSMFKVTSFNDLYIYSKQNGTMSVNDAGTLSIIDNAYSDTESFRTAMSGVQLCYELATPTEIQLTPQEVRTLLGVNNIWSDGGDMEVEYPADTKMYINKKITEAIAAAMA